MKRVDAGHVGIPWYIIIPMAGWLHLITVVFTLSKWSGLLHVSWIVVFLPSLLYGALLLLIVGSCAILELARRINLTRPANCIRHGL
jgi:uncharacterized integral membrane protein